MIAVILAAGRGERLRPLTDDLPKGLITLGGKTLLEHSLDKIAVRGIRRVIIVVGYKANEIGMKLGSNYANMELVYVKNAEYATTGSMYSLLAAREQISEDILLLESDLLFEGRALDVLLESHERNLILVSSPRRNGDEVFIRVDDNGHLSELGKHIDDEEKALGELVGISRLSLQFLGKLCHRAEAEFARNAKSLSYEDAIMLTAREENTEPVGCILIKDLLWTDIDNEDDLERAKLRIFPQIAGLDKTIKRSWRNPRQSD